MVEKQLQIKRKHSLCNADTKHQLESGRTRHSTDSRTITTASLNWCTVLYKCP